MPSSEDSAHGGGCHFTRTKIVLLVAVLGVVLCATAAYFALVHKDKLLEHFGSTGNLEQDSTTTAAASEYNQRLDPNVIPLHYDLYLHPDFQSGLYNGHVAIKLDVKVPTDQIRVNVKKLNVTDASFSNASTSAVVPFLHSRVYAEEEMWIAQLSETIKTGNYTLKLHFEGHLTPHIVGFYRSQYWDPISKTQKYVVSSKFQPTHARQAFPCFDEPGFKSTFTVTLVKPSELTALSNMPVSKTERGVPAPNLTTVTFAKSVPMVTYLVAFAIGDFDYQESMTRSGTPCRIYATRHQVNKTTYASTIAPRILDFYEGYFGIRYPLPKLDIIAIPDFVSGATEHWGMISFRETALLLQPDAAPPKSKQRIATVVAHEMAHMWFGNLMTLKWWDDLWLNEGFASYMEYKGVDYVQPDWDINSQFVSSDMSPVLALDGRRSSHPIVQPVDSPDQINEIFDIISYQKGASVIRMLENFMGPHRFQLGIRKFLSNYSFKNAVTQNLWDALQKEQPNVNITWVMDTWTRQTGYPLIKVSLVDPRTIEISQERYEGTPKAPGDMSQSQQHEDDSLSSSFNERWEVPLSVSTSHDVQSLRQEWIHANNKSIRLSFTSPFDWVKVNTGQIGYYRVQYSPEALKSIRKDYMSKNTPEERCGLLDDAFSLAFAHYTSYASAIEFSLALSDENHFVPWECVYPHLLKLLHLIESGGSASAKVVDWFKEYIKEIAYDQYRRLAWTDDSSDHHLNRLLKPRIFTLICQSGTPECRQQAKSLFDRWLNDETYSVPANLRGIVYKWGIFESNSTAWQSTWNRYLNETDATEKNILLKAISYTKNPAFIHQLLKSAADPTLIRKQDVFIMYAELARNPFANSLLWEHYRNHWNTLVARYTLNDRSFGKMISSITEYFTTEAQLKEMRQFMDSHPKSGAGKRARENALENVRNNIAWQKRNLPTIRAWLESKYAKKL